MGVILGVIVVGRCVGNSWGNIGGRGVGCRCDWGLVEGNTGGRGGG